VVFLLQLLYPTYLKDFNAAPGYLQHKYYNDMLLDTVISLIAPHVCVGCGVDGWVLCESCGSSELVSLPPRCAFCHARSPSSKVCTKHRSFAPIGHIWIRTTYDGIAETALRKYKFERARAAHKDIAKEMVVALPILPNKTVVVPVPTATSRVRLRGYDHAQLLAKYVARNQNFVYQPVLGRTGQTRQLGATRKTRLQQLSGAFYVRDARKITDKTILLIDDVMTTGATISSAAKILKAAGAKQVNALLFAQKV
jgi:ComF family protein